MIEGDGCKINDVIEFLRERIREDWDAADLVLRPYGDHAETNEAEEWTDEKQWMRYHNLSSDEAPLVSRMSPQRVMSSCRAKETIIEFYLLMPEDEPYTFGSAGRRSDMLFGSRTAVQKVLIALTLEYKDHPDFSTEWILGV